MTNDSRISSVRQSVLIVCRHSAVLLAALMAVYSIALATTYSAKAINYQSIPNSYGEPGLTKPPVIFASKAVIVGDVQQRNSSTVASVLPMPDNMMTNKGGSDETPPSTTHTAAATADSNVSAFVFRLNPYGQGFGSLTVNTFIYGMYFEKVHNRTFYIDERDMEIYQWNETFNLYEGFFEHNFPIYRGVEFEGVNVTSCGISAWNKTRPSYTYGCNVLRTYLDLRFRKTLFSEAKLELGGVVLAKGKKFRIDDILYNPLSKYICEKLPRLSQEAQQEVDALIQSAGLPPKFDVAFHIRRTDKILERPFHYWDAKNYLETYENANPTAAAKAKHCFLATDDYNTLDEVRAAMNQTNITCQLWTLTEENYTTTRGHEDFTMYLAQQQIMVQAEYFVGMFTSNVGTIVSLLRACPTWAKHGKREHYYNSYGVDYDKLLVPF